MVFLFKSLAIDGTIANPLIFDIDFFRLQFLNGLFQSISSSVIHEKEKTTMVSYTIVVYNHCAFARRLSISIYRRRALPLS